MPIFGLVFSLSPLKTTDRFAFDNSRASRKAFFPPQKSHNVKISHFLVAVWEARDLSFSEVSSLLKSPRGAGRESAVSGPMTRREVSECWGLWCAPLVCLERPGPMLPSLLAGSQLSRRLHRFLSTVLRLNNRTFLPLGVGTELFQNLPLLWSSNFILSLYTRLRVLPAAPVVSLPSVLPSLPAPNVQMCLFSFLLFLSLQGHRIFKCL